MVVGFVAKSLISSETPATTCPYEFLWGHLALAGGGAGNAGSVTISEGYAQVFKVRNFST